MRFARDIGSKKQHSHKSPAIKHRLYYENPVLYVVSGFFFCFFFLTKLLLCVFASFCWISSVCRLFSPHPGMTLLLAFSDWFPCYKRARRYIKKEKKRGSQERGSLNCVRCVCVCALSLVSCLVERQRSSAPLCTPPWILRAELDRKAINQNTLSYFSCYFSSLLFT